MNRNIVLGAIGVALFCAILFAPTASAQVDTEEGAAEVTVSGIVDISLNCSSLSLGEFSPGTANESAAQQCLAEIHSNTNTYVNLSSSATDFESERGTITRDNFGFTNTTGNCFTQYDETFSSGTCNNGGGYRPYEDWVLIVPSENSTFRDALFSVSIPSDALKAQYNGTIFLRITDSDE